MQKIDVAIIGVTGLVGEAVLRGIESSGFPVGSMYPLASDQSAGDHVLFNGESCYIEKASDFDFSKAQLVWCAVNDKLARHLIPLAQSAGCIVIDNSSSFRQDKGVPLIIPEINPEAVNDLTEKKIIASPNCSVTQLLMSVKPFLDHYSVSRIVVSTYQSVSGIGRCGLSDLIDQSHSVLEDSASAGAVYARKTAFNLLPQIGSFDENGYCSEELKIYQEACKILGSNTIDIVATTVRVPTFFGHAQSIHIDCDKPVDFEHIRSVYKETPGVQLLPNLDYPTPLEHGMTQDDVFVGRLRYDHHSLNSVNLWSVSDNLRKGAALNAVQIASLLLETKVLQAAK